MRRETFLTRIVYRSGMVLLQHTSLLFSFDLEILSDLFKETEQTSVTYVCMFINVFAYGIKIEQNKVSWDQIIVFIWLQMTV